MSRVIVVGTDPAMLLNFRGEMIKAIADRGHEVTAMATAAGKSEIAAIEALGAKFRSFPVQRNGFNPLADLATLRALRGAFSEISPDVVIAYTIKPVIWSGFALKPQPGVRFYALITGLGFAFHGRGAMRRSLTVLVKSLYRRALRRASGVMFQNSDNLATFVSAGLADAESATVLSGSGVNLDQFSFTPIPRDGFAFLTIARLLGEKGLREYAAAARMVKSQYPDARFRILGSADPSPDGIPLSEVRGWESDGAVEYLGSKADVRPDLRASTVFVLASYHEGMPRAVLEAMAIGRPILTTDVPGCRDTVVRGENGFLVRRQSADALAERMVWFIENQERLEDMGRRSRALAEEKFDVRSVNKMLLQFTGLSS